MSNSGDNGAIFISTEGGNLCVGVVFGADTDEEKIYRIFLTPSKAREFAAVMLDLADKVDAAMPNLQLGES